MIQVGGQPSEQMTQFRTPGLPFPRYQPPIEVSRALRLTFSDVLTQSLFHVPFIVGASHICRQTLNIATLGRLDFSITQKREAVLVPISYIVVL